MLAVGVAIGWSVKPESPVREVAAPTAKATSSERSSPSPTQVTSIEPRQKRPRTMMGSEQIKPDDEPSEATKLESTKMQEEMTKQLTDRQRAKFEKYILRISENVNLTESQKASLSTWMEERMKKLSDLDLTNPESITDITEMMEGISEKAISDQLMTSLTDEQKEAFTRFKEKEFQSKVDSSALKSLSQLQSVVDFEEGQRDEVYKILTAAAGEKVLQEQEQTDYTSMFTEGMGIDMDPYGLGIQQAMTDLMTESASSGQQMDNKATAKAMREMFDKRIEQKVEQLRPVLNEKQLEQYRTELKTKGLGVYGNAIMSMEVDEPGVDFAQPPNE